MRCNSHSTSDCALSQAIPQGTGPPLPTASGLCSLPCVAFSHRTGLLAVGFHSSLAPGNKLPFMPAPPWLLLVSALTIPSPYRLLPACGPSPLHTISSCGLHWSTTLTISQRKPLMCYHGSCHSKGPDLPETEIRLCPHPSSLKLSSKAVSAMALQPLIDGPNWYLYAHCHTGYPRLHYMV